MTEMLLLAFIFLAAAMVAVPIAARFALGSVLGYLLAGITISPLLAILKVDVASIQHFAEFGVVMMLFLVGLELEPKKIYSMRSRLLGLGGGQMLVTTIAVAAIARVLGLSWPQAVAVGLILSMSSTAIVLQTLQEKGLLKSDGGQSSFAVLLSQDIAVIPILAFIPLLASPELVNGIAASVEDNGERINLVANLNGWQTTLAIVTAVVLVIFGGSHLTAPIFRFIAIARLRELFTATALMFIVGIALLMSLVGLSPALGTFIAGVVLANSRYKHELESNIAPFKGLLLGLFFITVGAGIDFELLLVNPGKIILLTLGLMVLKCALLMALGHLFCNRGADKWLLALGLCQAGEFAFVLLSFTVNNGVLPKEITSQLQLVVALSMLLSPALFTVYERIVVQRYSNSQNSTTSIPSTGVNIIIAGSGRVGGLLDRIMRMGGFNTTVIDFSSDRLDALARYGVTTYFGDATQPDLLHAAGIDEAALLIVALDDSEQISKLVKYAIENYPNLHVLSRAVDRHHVYDLYAYGCRDIIRETYGSTLRMGRSAFEALGIERNQAEKMIAIFHESDRKAIVAAADAYKVGVPAHENEEYVSRIKEILEVWEPEVKKQMQEVRAESR